MGTTSNNKTFPFFDLPGELRSAILAQLLVSDHGIVLHSKTTLYLPAGSGRGTLRSVLQVSMQMYQEATAVFYGQNRFVVNAQSHRLPAHLTRRGGFLSPEGRDARRRVRRLTLLLTRVGGEFEHVLGPALSDMVLCGALRELRLRLGPPARAHPAAAGARPDRDLVRRSPFQALLRLLADPYLDAAELSVWKVHWAALCPFHHRHGGGERKEKGEEDEGEGAGGESVNDIGLATIRDGPDWVKLDWKNMVDVLGTGQQIVTVGNRLS
ncbi:hypothetical protein F4809DRAFT_234626 [Biscogniauxia mediterranea]|nr:hypothetical protein F4809DRAFT_234626 [Biscogniauxia mediterranea]